ncbi:MAG: DUF4367 domain-containing protein [Anaerolineae bacterium]
MSKNGDRFGGLDGDLSDAEEIRAANQLSEQIDRMLAGQPVDSADPRLVVAEGLRWLSDLLPAVDPSFERRALAPLQRPVRRRPSFPALGFPVRALSLAVATAVVVIALVLTVPGQTALARLAAIFQLDSVEVGINVATATPADVDRVVGPRIERRLDSLEMAQQVAPVPILLPKDLPEHWSLKDATAVYYPDLPANVPLNIILTYESPSGASLKFIEYFIRLGDSLTVDSLSRIDETTTSVREIMVDGRRAILVESGGIQDAHTLIWQQDGILLEVEALNMGFENLLALAALMQPVEKVLGSGRDEVTDHASRGSMLR